jgi:hypothetical protein
MRSVGALVATIAAVLALLCQTAGAWWLVQVGAHERSIEIDHTNACGRVVWHHIETRRTVAIWESVEPPPPHVSCRAILIISKTTIPLSHPLKGRHIRGGSKPYAGLRSCRRFRHAPNCLNVPRLMGLSLADARFLLGGLGLHAVAHIGRAGGLGRVTRQSPAAGAHSPANRIVRVGVVR